MARAAAAAAEGRAEHPHRAARRHRLRRGGHLRRRSPHADAHQARQRRPALQRLPHHRHLLAHARRLANRQKPHPRRLRHHRRARGRFRRLHRRHPEGSRDRRRGVEKLRLPHLRLRQMAQHARDRNHHHGPEGPLAERLRLRLLLRLPRRRDLAVGTAPRGKLQHRRTAARRPEVSPHRGHGEQGPRLDRRPPVLRARQALPHVLGAGRGSRPASHLPRVGGQIQRQVRRRLGRLPRTRPQTPTRNGHHPARHETHTTR